MKILRCAVAASAALGAAVPFVSVRASSTFRTLGPRATAPAAMRPKPDEVIVQFADGADGRAMDDAMRLAGGRSARRSASGRRFLVSLDDGFTPDEAMARLRTLPGVAFAERNGRVRASQAGRFTPNDEFFRAQWNMRL